MMILTDQATLAATTEVNLAVTMTPTAQEETTLMDQALLPVV